MDRQLKKHIFDWVENQIDFSYQKFVTKKGVLYYDRIIKEDLVRIIDDTLNIKFTSRNLKQIEKVLKSIEPITRYKTKTFFVLHLFPEKNNDFWEDIFYDDIHNMFNVYSKQKVYTRFKKLGINFKEYLADYIIYHKANKIFHYVYDDEVYADPNSNEHSSKLLGKRYIDIWGRNWNELEDNISSEDLKEELYAMKRVMKIKLFFKNDKLKK